GLDLGSTIERFLSRGEDHRYQIGLMRGEYARVVVDQQGLDVIVRVRAADGHVVAEFNDEIRARGEECVELVADATGVYSISVEPRPDALGSAPYVIRVADRRVATDADRSLYEARRLRTSAAALDDDGRFAPAAAQLERALTLTEHVRGADDVQVAAVASQLAGVYRTLPNNPRSEKLFERAVAILDKSLGADHPLTALT